MESMNDGTAAEKKFCPASLYPEKDEEQWLNTLWNKK
jgi:hypothetical protein